MTPIQHLALALGAALYVALGVLLLGAVQGAPDLGDGLDLVDGGGESWTRN